MDFKSSDEYPTMEKSRAKDKDTNRQREQPKTSIVLDEEEKAMMVIVFELPINSIREGTRKYGQREKFI